MKSSNDVEELCKKLKPVIGEKADKLWHMYLTEDDKSRREFALDLEIIAERLLKKDSLLNQEILLPPPTKDAAIGSFLVGDSIYNNKKYHSVYLKEQDFSKQVGIFAVTGEGKTNLAYLLALQLLKSKIPFIVIDWKRSWRNLLSLKDKYPELKKVQVYTIGRDVLPFYWNPFREPPGSDKNQWIGTISEVLEKSHLSGPGVAFHINKVFKKLFRGLSNDFYPNFYDGIKEIENIKALQRELKWKQSALRIFQSFTTGKASKAFNARNPLKLEDLLEKGVILELDLEMPKPMRVFFSELILRWIHLYRLSQGETDKLRHVLFLEEAHNLFTQSKYVKESNSSFENVYREIRAFGQGIVSITQHPSLLPIYLLGNCHTQIYLGLQHADDITTARKSLFLKYDEESYLNNLKVGECILKIKNRIDPCLVKTPLVPVKNNVITDDWLKAQKLSSMFGKYGLKHPSSRNYLDLKKNISDILAGKKISNNESGRNTSIDVDKNSSKNVEILLNKASNTPTYLKTQFTKNTPVLRRNSGKEVGKVPRKSPDNIKSKKDKYPLNADPNILLADICINPFSSITQRYKRLKLNTHYGNNLKKQLIEQKCIISRKVITGYGWITLFELTQKGRLILRDLGHEVKNTREGIVHRFWKNKIAKYYEKKGFKVFIEEYFITGRPDIIIMKQGKKVAIEIETGKSNIIYNIRKCLKAGFDEVFCVATNKNVEKKIKEELGKRKIKDDRVKVTNVMGF
jgi:hypothetical protein